MKISVEISFYPLNSKYIKPIGHFIERLNEYTSIKIKTNGMSTQIFGEYDNIWDILKKEIKKSFEIPASVFVLKIVNTDLQEIPTKEC